MGEEQLVGVMEIVQKQKAEKSGFFAGKIDAAKMKIAKETLRSRIAHESGAYYSTSRVWDDGIIDPRDTRAVLGICLAAINQGLTELDSGFGVFRM